MLSRVRRRTDVTLPLAGASPERLIHGIEKLGIEVHVTKWRDLKARFGRTPMNYVGIATPVVRDQILWERPVFEKSKGGIIITVGRGPSRADSPSKRGRGRQPEPSSEHGPYGAHSIWPM